MKETILSLVLEAISEVNETSQIKIDTSLIELTPLLSGKSRIDSITLVNLVVIIEEKIELEFDKFITIADEKAFSQKVSPFINVKSLVDYIFILLNE